MLFLSGQSQGILKSVTSFPRLFPPNFKGKSPGNKVVKSDICDNHGVIFYSVIPELKKKKERKGFATRKLLQV